MSNDFSQPSFQRLPDGPKIIRPENETYDIGEAIDVFDLKELNLPDRIRQIIEDGHPEFEEDFYAGPSEARMAGIVGMLQAGVLKEQILSVLLDESLAINKRGKGKVTEKFARDEIKRAVSKMPNAADDFADDIDPATVKIGGKPEPKEDDKPGHYAAFKPSELLALPSPKWLIRGILIERGLFEIYGRFKTGKTFWAIEMACCIATGRDFMDAPVKQGSVLYVIAEGSRKLFSYRVRQWAVERSNGDAAEQDQFMKLLDENLAIVPVAVFVDVKEKVEKFTKTNPQPRAVVFIDTLFRSMKGDVMNSDDMTNFVAGCAFIQRRLDAALVFLHHQKRNEAKGGFGSVVGEASVDGAMKVSSPRKGQTELRLEIMRDGDPNVKPWLCDLKVCEIEGLDLADDDVKTTGVLVFFGRGKGDVIDVLQAIYDLRDEDPTIDSVALKAGKPRRTVQRHLKTAREKGWMNPKGLTLSANGLRQIEQEDDDENDSDDDF